MPAMTRPLTRERISRTARSTSGSSGIVGWKTLPYCHPITAVMATRPTRSFKHDYELFVEQEIENYKESVPRSALLTIGDEAVTTLATQPQLALTELLLCEEVDRIIFRRLRLPSYQTWRRKRIALDQELRRPEHWGLRPDHVLVRAMPTALECQALLAGNPEDGSALYLAANGCDVTAITPEADALERVMEAAVSCGLAGRVRAHVGDLATWTPERPLHVVVVSTAALEAVPETDRDRVIGALQAATIEGGVHLVPSLLGRHGLTVQELRTRYRGWDVTVEKTEGQSKAFRARKALS